MHVSFIAKSGAFQHLPFN